MSGSSMVVKVGDRGEVATVLRACWWVVAAGCGVSLPRALHKPWRTCNQPTSHHLHHPSHHPHNPSLYQHHLLPRSTPQLTPPTSHQHPHLQQLQKTQKVQKIKESIIAHHHPKKTCTDKRVSCH